MEFEIHFLQCRSVEDFVKTSKYLKYIYIYISIYIYIYKTKKPS